MWCHITGQSVGRVLEETVVVVAVKVQFMLNGVGEAVVGNYCSGCGIGDGEYEVGGVCARMLGSFD
jgi:hypothetical protein